MASKNTASPDPLTSQLTHGRATMREEERSEIRTTLQLDSGMIPKQASNMSVLDHVSILLREAMSLVDNDCDASTQNHATKSMENDQSSARHLQ